MVVVFEEGRVAVDSGAEPFAEYQFGVGNVQGGMEGCAGGVLHAVIGPERLRAVGCLYGCEGCSPAWVEAKEMWPRDASPG